MSAAMKPMLEAGWVDGSSGRGWTLMQACWTSIRTRKGEAS